MENKKILITGCAGYLGQILYPILAKKHEVIGMDNFLYNQIVDFPVVKADITSLEDMYRLTKGVDVVVALAGIVGDPACGLDEEKTKVVNLHSTKLLAEVCETNEVKRIIFASSCSVYGTSHKTIDENSILNPLSLYAETKIDSENVLLERCKETQLTILRFGTLYGWSPRMRFDLVVNIMTAMAVKEGKIILNNGDQWRPLVHVSDVAKTISHIIDAPRSTTNIYNVVTENYTVKNLAEIVANMVGAKVIEKKLKGDLRDYQVACRNESYLSKSMNVMDGIEEVQKNMEKIENYKDDKYYNVRILEHLKL